MTLYNLYSGGIMYCSGRTKANRQCKRRGYTTDRSSGYYCNHHQEQRAS